MTFLKIKSEEADSQGIVQGVLRGDKIVPSPSCMVTSQVHTCGTILKSVPKGKKSSFYFVLV